MKGRGQDYSKEFDEKLRRQLKFLDYAPILHISALTGERTPKLLEDDRPGGGRAAASGPDRRAQPVPRRGDRRASAGRQAASEVRILYAAQTGVAPPTFVFFTNVATEFHFSYERFLINRLRESFGMEARRSGSRCGAGTRSEGAGLRSGIAEGDSGKGD